MMFPREYCVPSEQGGLCVYLALKGAGEGAEDSSLMKEYTQDHGLTLKI